MAAKLPARYGGEFLTVGDVESVLIRRCDANRLTSGLRGQTDTFLRVTEEKKLVGDDAPFSSWRNATRE